jgi:thioredoxin 1
MTATKSGGYIILLLSLFIISSGCSKTAAESTGANNPQSIRATTPPIVTFIELGSVNCIPCKMMQPIMRDIESSYQGQVAVIFYDVWTQADAPRAKQYGIRVIPTQVFLDSNGNEYYRHEGFFPKEDLVAVLKKKGVK